MVNAKAGTEGPVEVRAERAMTPAPTLKERYEQTMARVGAAAKRSGRSPGEVIVVAVSKYAEPEQIRELMALGHRDFGENRAPNLLQRAAQAAEWLERGKALAGVAGPGAGLPEGVRWHMIGRMQRNKVKKVIDAARLIHSVDSLRLAEEIQGFAAKREQPVEVLLQMNCSNEGQKGGVALPAATHLAEQIESMVNVRLRGVMTMAALGAPEDELRRTFERCRERFGEMQRRGVGGDRRGAEGFNILSMGMSDDFEIAIEEGANVVRIGTAIFGPPSAETLRLIEGQDKKEDAEKHPEE